MAILKKVMSLFFFFHHSPPHQPSIQLSRDLFDVGLCNSSVDAAYHCLACLNATLDDRFATPYLRLRFPTLLQHLPVLILLASYPHAISTTYIRYRRIARNRASRVDLHRQKPTILHFQTSITYNLDIATENMFYMKKYNFLISQELYIVLACHRNGAQHVSFLA